MQIKLFSAALLSVAFMFTQAAHANMPPKPDRCPGASAIKSAGIEVVMQSGNGTWVAGIEANKYDTADAWTFAVGEIPASSEEDARAKAIESLRNLQFKLGPVPVAQYNVWACLYQTDQGYRAISVTPPFGLTSALQMTK